MEIQEAKTTTTYELCHQYSKSFEADKCNPQDALLISNFKSKHKNSFTDEDLEYQRPENEVKCLDYEIDFDEKEKCRRKICKSEATLSIVGAISDIVRHQLIKFIQTKLPGAGTLSDAVNKKILQIQTISEVVLLHEIEHERESMRDINLMKIMNNFQTFVNRSIECRFAEADLFVAKRRYVKGKSSKKCPEKFKLALSRPHDNIVRRHSYEFVILCLIEEYEFSLTRWSKLNRQKRCGGQPTDRAMDAITTTAMNCVNKIGNSLVQSAKLSPSEAKRYISSRDLFEIRHSLEQYFTIKTKDHFNTEKWHIILEEMESLIMERLSQVYSDVTTVSKLANLSRKTYISNVFHYIKLYITRYILTCSAYIM